MSVPDVRVRIAQKTSDGADVTAISRPVRGGTWIEAARLQNWLAGRGAMDVPAHAPMAYLDDTASATFRYWTKPRFQTARYAYHLSLTSAEDAPARARVTIDGVSSEVPVGSRSQPSHVTLFRDRSSLSTTETELAIEVRAAEGLHSLTVESISIESVPRSRLLVPNDLGANRLNYLARAPINDRSIAAELLGRQAALRAAARRVGLFQFSRGDESPWTRASGTPANLFAVPFSLTGRKLFNGQTSTSSGVTKWRALARVSNGTTSGLLTLTGGATVTVPTSATSWTWITGTNFSHACEDNATADGYQSGTPDERNIAFSRTAGSGTVSVATVSFIDVGE